MLRVTAGRTPRPRHFDHRMGGKCATVEEVCARIARHNHGIVTRTELLAAGVSSREIERRQERGSLIVEFCGVYRVGHRAPSLEASYLAAVKACGDEAALSDLAAGHLYELIKGPPPVPHVTAPRKRRVTGVVSKGSREIERTAFRGIPITTVARTLVDLAAPLSLTDLARACHEAGVKYGATPAQVEEILARHPNAKGARKLRKVMHGAAPVTQSALERRFLQLLTADGLPLPVTNRPAGSFRVDCRWPELRLTVELDSYRFHNSRHAWERDRRREREARARGDDFRRYTYGDVYENRRSLLRELRPLLRSRGI